jgi:hypothetical protein
MSENPFTTYELGGLLSVEVSIETKKLTSSLTSFQGTTQAGRASGVPSEHQSLR